MPDVVLEARSLTRRFEGLTALADVSFRVERGEVYGVMGPNGAGKTTLFSCLVGALAPSAGSVRFRDEELAGLAPNAVVRRGLVRTHQIVRPFRDMTVRENVSVGAAFGTGQRRGKVAEALVTTILERTLLLARADRPAGSLTIGESKRLEIARALATEPEVLCLDEVLGGLNPSEINTTLTLIRSIRESGVTVLMIEHHVHALRAVTDRLLVLNFGRMIAEGTPADVLREPVVIAAYLGEEPS